MTQTRTAFVTGATAGIGEATVRTLVANGWRCVATGRRQERLDALVADLGADKVHPACFDVRDADATDAAIAALPEREAQVIQLYYVEELNLEEIGLVIGVGSARVCQIKAAAHARLKKALANRL